MQSWIRPIVLTLAFSCFLGAGVAARGDTDVVGKITGERETMYADHQRMVVLVTTEDNRKITMGVDNADDNKPMANPKPELLDQIKTAATSGSIVKVSYRTTDKKLNMFTRLALYEMQPGEELPNAYVFSEVYPRSENGKENTYVDVKKWDQPMTFIVPPKKDSSGQMVADPDVVAALGKAQKGQVILADVSPGGKTPTIRTAEVFNKPQEGTITEIDPKAELNGAPTASASIDVDGKTVKVFVPVKTEGKHSVADARIREKLLRFKPKSEVMFRTIDDNGVTILRDMQPAPKQPKTTTTEKPAMSTTTDKKDKK